MGCFESTSDPVMQAIAATCNQTSCPSWRHRIVKSQMPIRVLISVPGVGREAIMRRAAPSKIPGVGTASCLALQPSPAQPSRCSSIQPNCKGRGEEKNGRLPYSC